MALPSVFQLQCSCNRYPWGMKGSDGLAAQLCEKTPGWDSKGPPTKFKIDENEAYAEMWMGTYPELPSYVLSTGQNLQDVIDRNKDQLIGEAVLEKFGHSNLPFLPKVLSIAKALPLQLHPNKEMAAELHKKDPSNFTDPNHKPEIALALTDFEAFAGFKPLEKIHQLLKLKPLEQFLPKSGSFGQEDLREVVRQMLTAEEDVVFRPPMNEFNILVTELGKGEQEVINPIEGPTVSICTSGRGTLSANGEDFKLGEGTVWFVGKGTEVKLESDSNLVMHTAYADPST
ncbi:hypothetical protein KVT40_004987 [Elsinoe batatas]|uniref:Mannose-6-phosphate isomerase n=1 Tax=Elsinoe batatas TaxID=2601811 RepID=A0A8K0L2Y6_9PEZI|nr:hypothetical protein KVT40_004987 [Elsinoe batatas]